MEFTVPDELRYAESHEWIETTDGNVRVGISDFAQDELGDIVFVDLPSEGDELDRGEEFGVVESIKAVSDLYSPVAGTVTAVNEDVFDEPELINESPFDDGWMMELEPSEGTDHLLSPEEYRDQI
ncbi:glycine cleavage system protein GcvH [Natrarchaeobius chitinivorans]|uniref:Probable glycine cleavage system H protein n=1 Tax=Natrarchaeobius chitinivorans TaxID=1679083 RepID=A0A3N6LWA4_NATCH|nr:glycine cleavage system protein GcvH [Natrarchaeobius chitinivorans]RQG94883.1 glycine cleavage system protein GcvH [Natrarchaeobius chitinivorans]